MLRLIGALLVGILSASLAVIYQNDIAAYLGRAPIAAEVIVGAWHPHPVEPKRASLFTDAEDHAIADFADDSEIRFARFTINNNTGRRIEGVFIKIEEARWARFDAIVLVKDDSEIRRTFIDDAQSRIELGPLEPADKIVAYVWSTRTFGWPYGFDGVSIITADGNVPKHITALRAKSDFEILGFPPETVAWAFLFFALALGGILLGVNYHTFKFAKSLLRDEDYYLQQKEVFDEDPEKYAVPDKLPKLE